MTDLLPCPFCGKDTNEWSFYPDDHQVTCRSCGASTRSHTTAIEAMSAWNIRAATKPAVPCRVCGHAEPESDYVPPVPDITPIRKVARECGYALAVHGSLKRDCDLIAVAWTDEAKPAQELIEAICSAVNAHVVGNIEDKPHGRIAASIQIDAWCKYIDLSIISAQDPAVLQEVINKLGQIKQGTGTKDGQFQESLIMCTDTMRELASEALDLLGGKEG